MHSAAAIFPANSPRLSPSLRSMSSRSSFASAHSAVSTAPFSLNALLAPESALATSAAMGRAGSISSASQVGSASICSYSRDELERERELFGESAMGVFEPRDQVMGFWGLTEVLRGEHQ